MPVLGIIAAIALLLVSCQPANASTVQPAYTYGDFSRMFERSAGQYVDRDGGLGQWAWSPQSDGTTHIQWGSPSSWPPKNYERFSRSLDGQWVLLDGYGEVGGQFVPQVVTSERVGDGNCQNMKVMTPTVGQKQRYTKWNVSSPYCLESGGYILYQGTQINFYHRQVWSLINQGNATCGNRYYSNRVCVRQHEIWKDNNCFVYAGPCGGPLVLRHDRDNVLALGLGPAFVLHRYGPDNVNWHADGRNYWNWGM